MRKNLTVVGIVSGMIMICSLTASNKLIKHFEPFSTMQGRKPLFGIPDKERLPVRPVIQLTDQFKEERDQEVIARFANGIESQRFFQVFAFKTMPELFVDKKLIKECAEFYKLKEGTFKLCYMPQDNKRILLKMLKTKKSRIVK